VGEHEWFYRLIPREGLRILAYYLEPDDIEQELSLSVISLAEQYNGAIDRNFVAYLHLHLPRRIRDLTRKHVTYYYNCQRFLRDVVDTDVYYTDMQLITDYRLFFSTEWLFSRKYNHALTVHERYLLHLYFYRCYTLAEIANLLYSDVTTTRNQLEDVYAIIQSEEALAALE
jgi:DNA-directed RNA polymerase specialized sigma24 family protein